MKMRWIVLEEFMGNKDGNTVSRFPTPEKANCPLFSMKNHTVWEGRWQGLQWLPNVHLIDFRAGIEAQLHIHMTIKEFLYQSLYNSVWHLVRSHAYKAASKQRKGKCFNMFSAHVRTL